MKYLIFVAFSIFVSPCRMKEAYNIKLIGSSLQYAGQVQISISGSQWASICRVGWDIKDAIVVCRQLNYITAEAAILGEAFGHAPGQVDKNEFHCFGNESSLSQCPTSEIKNVICGQNNVAAVLCKPYDLFPVFILISLVGCLALTSIAILIITCKAMIAGKKRCPAKKREIGLSNAIIERDIEVCSSTEGKRELNGSGDTFSSDSYSNFEDVENSCPVVSVNTNHKKKETPNSVSNAELIESISSLEARHRDIDQEEIKRKESRKGRYMSLLKGSRTFLHFYEKLLKRNKDRQSATDIDYALDYYSSDQDSQDWQGNNINDINIISDEEYLEICPEEEQDQEKVDKDKNGSEYVPMLSLSLMQSRELSVNEETQEEYLEILPPGAVGKEKSLSGSSKRDSDYLHPVEADLPAFPETPDNMASCSYGEKLPQPPQDLATVANNHQDKKKRNSPSGPLGLTRQRCRCENEKDLMCKNCLDCHVKQNIVEQELDDELDYVPMEHCKTGEKDNKTNLRRNSADYTIPMKSAQVNKKDHGSFPEELNKINLNRKIKNDTIQSCDKELGPNKKKKFNPAVKGVMKEKGYKGLTSPRNARKEDEELSNEKSPLPEKTAKPDVSATRYFENNTTVANSLDKTKKKAAFSTRAFNSEEIESTGIPIPTSSNTGKPRSESCPVVATNWVKPSTSFIAALENALKSREGAEGISERDEKEIDTENEYELDYEDIRSSPDESKYENNDISSGSRPGSYEYDYVHEKHRKSLHFYEAVSKQSEESEEDQYEKI